MQDSRLVKNIIHVPSSPKLLLRALLTMKIFLIIMLAAILQVSAKGYGQGITLKEANAPMGQVLKKIEKQSNYMFWYTDEIISKARRVNVNVNNASITEALEMVFKDQPLTWTILEKSVVIKEKRPKTVFEQSGVMVLGADPIDIKGKVVNESGDPVEGVTVTVKNTNISTNTDVNGEYSLHGINPSGIIVFTHVSMQTLEVSIGNQTTINILLSSKIVPLSDVTVTYSSGYQEIPKERSTGSFEHFDIKLLNRRIGYGILDRIENLSPSVLFDRNANSPDKILIRGRSTFYSNSNPLVILDHFPYDGDINNINPNDIESITILKDAASASIWGARAANGVIVINTKRGTMKEINVEVNSNITTQNRPKLTNIPTIKSSDYIELEEILFEKGYYNSAINSFNAAPLSPVVEILIKKQTGSMTEADAQNKIEAMKGIDFRDDLSRYFYQQAWQQQHALSISGNTAKHNYYFSAGWDNIVPNLVGERSDRVTIRTRNIFKIAENFNLEVGTIFSDVGRTAGENPGYNISNGAGKRLFPYADLVDAKGNALALLRDYRALWTDTVGGGKLPDWKYLPLAEIKNSELKIKLRDYILNLGAQYKITQNLSTEFWYQYENQLTQSSNWRKSESYYVRDMVNRFFQPNSTNKFPVPLGGIIDFQNNKITSHQGRAQLNFDFKWGKNNLIAVAGAEIRNITSTSNLSRVYGYDKEKGSSVNPNINFQFDYPQFQWGIYSNFATSKIPNPQSISGGVDRYLSYFANVGYSLGEKYHINLSARKDASNLFGAKANQKWVPLWSSGLSWLISKERFFRFMFIPYLKLRVTYGFQGNMNKLSSALPTVTYENSLLNALPIAVIQNPPNERLRWEKVGTFNFGLEFALKKGILTGDIEFYKKNATDLLATAPMDPTTGISSWLLNIGNIKGYGFDIQLQSALLNKRDIKWKSIFIFSKSINKVSSFNLPTSTLGQTYVVSNFNPYVGRPLFGLYSYYWGGLDNQGNPIGFVGKEKSIEYSTILAKTRLDSMSYAGSIQPTTFGSFRNDFTLYNITLSVNISFKLNYYFRKSSIDYASLFSTWSGHSDYALRWQKAGDENQTTVPSMSYPVNLNRDFYYNKSEVLIRKGDHIRLEDIRIAYEFASDKLEFLPVQGLSIYALVSNLGILWASNKEKLDPYFLDMPKANKLFSFGLKVTF